MIEGLEPDTKGTMDSLVDLAEQLQTKIINEDVVAMDVQAKLENVQHLKQSLVDDLTSQLALLQSTLQSWSELNLKYAEFHYWLCSCGQRLDALSRQDAHKNVQDQLVSW